MRAIIFLMALLDISYFSIAQELSGTVVSSGGDRAQNSSFDISFTIGECAVSDRMNEEVLVNEGFQQNWNDNTLTGFDLPEYEEAILCFPNPMYDQLWVSIETDHPKDFTLTLFDLTGRKIATKFDFFVHGSNTIYRLDVSSLLNGTYILIVQSGSTHPKIGFKVIK